MRLNDLFCIGFLKVALLHLSYNASELALMLSLFGPSYRIEIKILLVEIFAMDLMTLCSCYEVVSWS